MIDLRSEPFYCDKLMVMKDYMRLIVRKPDFRVSYSLPECLKAIEKPQRFKVTLKKYLIKDYQETELCDFLFY